MLTLLLLKSYLGKILDFCIANWRLCLFGLILCTAIVYKTRYERTTRELALFKSNIAQLAIKQEAENATKVAKAKTELVSIVAVHDKQIDLIKAEYEKRTNTSTSTIASLRHQLRDSIASSIKLPETAPNPSSTPEEWRNSYATLTGQYQTLKDGCAVTTSDYNALRAYADNNCAIFGCE